MTNLGCTSFLKHSILTNLLFLAVWVEYPVLAEENSVDSNLPNYQKSIGVEGKVVSVGSDTLANLMTFWAEGFKKIYPNISVQIQAAGSSTAPPALSAGTSNFGPMSRKMKDKEISAFEDVYGYPPTPVGVAIDGLAIYVNKDNPIAEKSLTIAQVDAIFSSTFKCGASKSISKWGQLGLVGSWESLPIQLYGRNSVSGTYGFFKKKALCKGDFKNSVNEQPGSSSVVQSVTKAPGGIGYAGIGYRTSGVKFVPLAKKSGSQAVLPTVENVVSSKYPLARLLYVYVNKHPSKPLPPLEQEFLKMVLSKQGQLSVVKDGYVPLPAGLASKEFAKIIN